MPAISIVIPAYNKADYLAACLNKLRQQTFEDIEIVVVNDCSPDNTHDAVAELAAQDSRIRLIDQPTNQGTLVARVTGALQTTGDYVTFMDQDDELEPDACAKLMDEMTRKPVDILHFGVKVDAANDLAAGAAQGMTEYMNPKPRELSGDDILTTVFSDDGYDWNVHHKLYRGDMLRAAVADLAHERLTRPDDAYIYFAVAAHASSYRALADAQWYVYHLGRGVTLGDTLTLRTFKDISDQDAKALELVDRYVHDHCNTEAAHTARKELCAKLIANTMNEWQDHIDAAHKAEALGIVRDSWNDTLVATELYRFLRDAAYDALQHYREDGTVPAKDDEAIERYRTLIAGLYPAYDDFTTDERYARMKHDAELHLSEFESDRTIADWNAQRIRIFVTTHKPVDMPRSRILQPVQVGGGLKDPNSRFRTAFHDDDGENISVKNPMYCELTTQYWAWKNVDADYYGFCHYRRYFDFSATEHEENPYGEVMDDYIDAAAAKEYGLDDATMTKAIEGWDVITTGIKDLREVIDNHGTPKKLYAAAPKLHLRDLRHVYDILCAMHPDYKEDADAFLDGNTSCFCNMYIMRKELFFAYCEWMFPILEEFERTTDMASYSKEALRTPGHLSERLFNIWLMHLKRTTPELKTKELQCVHFTNPDPAPVLEPLSPAVVDGRPIVPVVFAADNNYVAQLTTTIYSAMRNASPDRYYDVTVLQKDIAWERQETMRRFFAERFDNMTLRFADVKREIAGYNLTTSNAHISIETYYRFLIQKALPFYGKVLYLDSDIVIRGDIAQLFDTELGDNLLAAVHDVDYLGNLNMNDGIRMKYTRETLGMKRPYGYFQAGVLVLNTAAMRRAYTVKQWLEYASEPSYIYNDQDVLNVHCEGRVTYLPWNWNVMHDCANRVANVFSYAPNAAYDAYMESRRDPQIIHYAGFEKPWTKPDCDFADVYWSYARETPFYEMLMQRVAQAAAQRAEETARQVAAEVAAQARPRHDRAVGETSPLRKVIDPIAPIGSRRREALKAVGRAVRGRK
ncbi:glycosyl transferase, family 8 [Bifidobacterium sp. DSM 109958]|uniref:Glycosyl transferase, family 8 n=1 Tax=Bifidobacterium moraviense TaxID=2675323 RepID=A0A7Y0F2K1_9BIFI|nr:DUF4422 domain-containing protein [Bifidobacterium sp. DSM 109958]NMN00823.1 glycosyl transferase, family 8 [Bifidobacterium sp. DSM 109958]